MKAEDTQSQGRNILYPIGQFAVGVSIALFVDWILLTYAWHSSTGASGLQIGIAVGFAILSGILSVVWGDKFVNSLVTASESIQNL
jgi:hypothetical protein